MKFTKRKELELSLIDDYIKIIIARNFFDNMFNSNISEHKNFQNTKLLTQNLEKIYDLILKKLNLDNLSLLILKKELKTNNSLYLIEKNNNFINTIETTNKIFDVLQSIECSVANKIKHFKFK